MVLKKEGVLFILATLLIVFFNLNTAEAGTLCADNQIILRLSSQTNAHGEIWNGAGNYPVEICYDRIFNKTGNGDRTCQPANVNKIVGLSATTNAHAESPSQSNYPVNVCYGNMVCNVRTNNCGVDNPNETLVVSLSSDTNAHLANSSSYPRNVCCTSGFAAQPVCTLNSAAWDVSETVEGQVVDLEVITTNCQGLQMSFNVKEKDGFGGSDDNVVTNPVNTIVALDGTAVSNWTAEWQAEGWPESDPPEYYFTATLVSTGENRQSSNELLVYQTIPEPGGIVICSDYGNQQACNDDLYQVADNSVPANVDCSDPNTNCFCSWNTGTMSCDAGWTGSNSSGSDIGTCYYAESSTDTCEDDGYLTVDLTATWVWDPSCDAACQSQNQPLAASCQSSQEVFQCPAQIPLPFFTFYNLLAALVLIAIVYWAISMRKKGRKGKRKKR